MRSLRHRSPRDRSFDATSFKGVRAAGWVVMIFLYLPMLVVIAYSFNAGQVATLWQGFTFDWFGHALQNESIRRATTNSFVIATFVAVISVTLATAGAIGMHTMSPRSREFALGLTTLPLIIPGIVLAVSLLGLFAAFDVPLGRTTVVVGQVALCTPFALLPIRTRLAGIDPSLQEAAADLGASTGAVLRRITLPQMVPGVASGALLAFIVSLDDFIIAFFLSGPDSTTLPLYIFSSVRVDLSPEINALSTILLVLTVLLMLLSNHISKTKDGPA